MADVEGKSARGRCQEVADEKTEGARGESSCGAVKADKGVAGYIYLQSDMYRDYRHYYRLHVV